MHKDFSGVQSVSNSALSSRYKIRRQIGPNVIILCSMLFQQIRRHVKIICEEVWKTPYKNNPKPVKHVSNYILQVVNAEFIYGFRFDLETIY